MAADAAVSGGWTAPRQVVTSLLGDDSCGVASEVRIPTPNSMHPLQRNGVGAREGVEANGTQSILEPRRQANVWYRLPAEPIGIFIGGMRSSDDQLVVGWGRGDESDVRRIGGGVVELPRPKGRNRESDWSFVTDESFPARPPGAEYVLLAPRRKRAYVSRMTTSDPVVFRTAQLSTLLRDERVRPAIDPFYFEATPCAKLPILSHGVADAPQLMVEWIWGPNLVSRSSPFAGIADAYTTFGVPVEFQGRTEDTIVVHWAVDDVRESIAPPTRRTWAE
jgi:hypothetical protein